MGCGGVRPLTSEPGGGEAEPDTTLYSPSFKKKQKTNIVDGWMADVCTSVCAASWTAVWWLQLCLVSRSPIGA